MIRPRYHHHHQPQSIGNQSLNSNNGEEIARLTAELEKERQQRNYFQLERVCSMVVDGLIVLMIHHKNYKG